MIPKSSFGEAEARENGEQPGSVQVAESGIDDGRRQPGRDGIFEILSNQRRRYVLAYLKQQDDGKTTLRALVTQVAAWENDVPLDRVGTDDRKSVYVGMRQTHLPKMGEYGLIDYDDDRGTVTLTDAAREAQMHLEYVPEDDIPWSYHYAGLSLLMTTILGLAWLGIYPFGGVDGMTLAAITVATVGMSSLVHSVYTRRNKLSNSFETGG